MADATDTQSTPIASPAPRLAATLVPQAPCGLAESHNRGAAGTPLGGGAIVWSLGTVSAVAYSLCDGNLPEVLVA